MVAPFTGTHITDVPLSNLKCLSKSESNGATGFYLDQNAWGSMNHIISNDLMGKTDVNKMETEMVRQLALVRLHNKIDNGL